MAQTDYDRGVKAAREHGHENGWEANGESRQFWAGFSDQMRGQECQEGPMNEGGIAL